MYDHKPNSNTKLISLQKMLKCKRKKSYLHLKLHFQPDYCLPFVWDLLDKCPRRYVVILLPLYQSGI